MKIKKIMTAAGIVSASVIALTGCSRLQGPEAKLEESKRDKSYSESMLYVDSYDMEVSLKPEQNSLEASATAELYNNTGNTLDEIVFRLPSAACLESKGGGLSWEVTGAYLGSGGTTNLEYTIDPENSGVIRVSLGENKLDQAGSTFVTLAVKEDIPEEDIRFGHFKAGNHDQYVLSECFPKVVEFRDNNWVINDIDWTGEKVSADTSFSQTSDYHVKMTMPDGYYAVGTGGESIGENATTINAVDARDFAVVASNGIVSAYWTNDNLVLRYYYLEGSKDNETGQEAVSWRVPTGLDWMEDFIKKYPWNQYDIVTVYSDYDANSYPGMMVFGDKAVYDGIRGDEVDSMRDFYKLHLTEHIFDQWFGEIVGCNEATDGWLNKGLRFWFNDYAMANVYGDISERAVGETIREMKKKEPAAMEMKLSDKFPDGKTADIVNTYRGAEFLEDLYGALGKDEFLKAISDYVIKYEFKEADSEKFIEVMKAHTGKDIQAVVDKYF